MSKPNSRQRKALAVARPKLHPTSEPLAYGLAVAGPPPGRTVLLLLLTAVPGFFLFGVGLLFFITFWAFNQPRAVITTSNSVVLMGRSVFNGMPTNVRVVVAIDELLAAPGEKSGGWRAYRLGDERVWMTKKEARLVVDAARGIVDAYAATTSTP